MNHSKKPTDEESTKTLLRELVEKKEYYPTPCGKESCYYEKNKDKIEKVTDTKFLKNMLKFLGIVYGIAAPWFIWTTLSINELKSDMLLVKQRQEVIMEIKQDITTIKTDLQQLKIDVAVIKKDGK